MADNVKRMKFHETAMITICLILAGCSLNPENSGTANFIARQSGLTAPTLTAPTQQNQPQTQATQTSPVINNGARNRKTIALTFDADMTPYMLHELQSGKVKSWYDEKITDTLGKENVPATIFMTGMWAQLYPDKVREFAANPLLEIENHSWDHAAFSSPCYKLAQATDKQSEIMKTQEILAKITGRAPVFFRFPGGCYGPDDITLVDKLGLRVVGWDVVSGDAFSRDGEKIEKNVLDKAANGSIIVMHLDGGPDSPATSSSLPEIIKGLRDKGIRFVLLKDLLLQDDK